MKVEFEKLEETINQLKEELIQIVEATGLNSYDTLNCSQELDKHISRLSKISTIFLKKSFRAVGKTLDVENLPSVQL